MRVPWIARSNQSTLKEINPDYSGRTDAEAPVLWPPDGNNRLIRKDPDAGKERGQKEKGATEAEVAGWQHRLNRHEFAQTLETGRTGQPGELLSMGLQLRVTE